MAAQAEPTVTLGEADEAVDHAGQLIDDIARRVNEQLSALTSIRQQLHKQLEAVNGRIDQLQQLHDLSGYSRPEGLDAADQELSTRVLLALAEHGPASSSDLRDVVELVADEEARRLGPTVASLSRSGRIARPRRLGG